MKYTIISIDDTRAAYKENLRSVLSNHEEVIIPATDARVVDINEELAKRSLYLPSGADVRRRGELGVWCSTFDCWKWAVDNDEPLLVFEDDAIATTDFNDLLSAFVSEIPHDYDFLSLWVPPNQYLDFVYDSTYTPEGEMLINGPNKNSITSQYNYGAIRTCLAYQGYGNVAMLYSPKGAANLIELAYERGITEPLDCFIFLRAHLRRIDGYAPKPNWAKAVDYDWPETTIHTTERFE